MKKIEYHRDNLAIFGPAFLIVAVFVLVTVVLLVSADKQFKADCHKWQKYEKEYPEFELNAPMIQECADQGISIK